MRQRILFVDDDALVLQGLQRMLRPMREEFEMEFKSSGAEALAAMARTPFDVVVADMRMPGMTGAQLLDEVMKIHPTTIRLILSGHADIDMVAQCVGATHQYLSKPCDATTLRNTIHRVSTLDGPSKNDALRRLVGRLEKLPSLPSVYVEIVEALRGPERELSSIGQIVARDIALTAQILKLVNSAFFGLRREVSDPAEAVSYLGVDTLKTLALSVHLFTEYKWIQVPGFSLETLSSHSLQTAAAAKAILRTEGATRPLLDDAFCAGMLHDAGKLILVYNLAGTYGQVLDTATASGRPLVAVEKEILGVNHAEVGGYLLGLWGLPARVVEAIALHHGDLTDPQAAATPCTAVQAANRIVNRAMNPKAPPALWSAPAIVSNPAFAKRWTQWEHAVAEVLRGEAEL